MNKVKNIVVVADNANVDGGAIQVAVITARVLADAGYCVVFFSGVGEPDPLLDGIEVVTALDYSSIENPSKLRGALQGIWSARAKRKLIELLRRFSPEDTVVHIHNWTHTLSPSVFSAVKEAGFQAVVTLHDYFISCPNGGLYNYVTNRKCDIRPMSMKCIMCNCDKRSYAQKIYRCIRVLVQRRCLSNCDVRFLHLSRFTYELMRKKYPFFDEPIFLPNPIELIRSNVAGRTDGRIDGYLFVGRLVPEKNPELFCNAITRAGVSATVVGDGPMLEELRRRYPDIVFTGWVGSNVVADCYSRHRALVLSSGCYEASPLVCAEALVSAGIPSIVPSTCGATDYIKDGYNGLWFESDDVGSLVDSILIMEDEERYKEICQNISRTVDALIEERSYERYLGNLIKIYSGVLNV